MLQKNTVATATLELLNRIMKDEFFSEFVLVGGTALALLLGHRKSIDLDLFCVKYFDERELLDHLRINYAFELDFSARSTIKGEIEGVKVDFLAHPYPWLQESFYEEDIRLASINDLAAMKLNAISINGSRIKDFIDVAYLSSILTLSGRSLKRGCWKCNASPISFCHHCNLLNQSNFPSQKYGSEPTTSTFSWKSGCSFGTECLARCCLFEPASPTKPTTSNHSHKSPTAPHGSTCFHIRKPIIHPHMLHCKS